MKKTVKRKKPNVLGTVLLGLLTALTVTAFLGFSYYVANIYIYSEPRVIEIPVERTEDGRPTYEYLKSITVEIEGHAKYDPMQKLIEFLEEFKKFFDNVEYVEEDNILKWTGTGVIVKVDREYTYILTNNHIAGEGHEEPTIYVKKRNKLEEVEILKRHSTLDMAILRFKGKLKDKRAVKGVSIANPQDRVYIVGHHLGRPYIYGEGVFAGYDGVNSIVQLPCLYGNSGSGIVNKDGELIALVYAISKFGWIQVDPIHAIAIDGTSIRLFLDKYSLI